MVGRAVHRHDPFFRQQVVQQRKYRFLVLTCVFCAADQDHLFVEVHRNDGFRAAIVFGWISRKARAVDHGEVRDEIIQRVALGAAQHVANEQTVPSQLGHHTHVDRVFRIGPTDQILDEVITPLHMRQHVLVKRIKAFRRHLGVVFPPDFIGNAVGFYDMFILGGASGEFARRHKKRAALA